MPLINGQKMACVPCIRGHRSTKCTHSADRVMVPVRKPGRPLSSCACPPGQSCACGGIKVAIPRKQKCKCGSDPTKGDHEGHDIVKPEMPTPAPTPSELPVSPTRNSVSRVQKTAPNARQNGRKQSFDPINLERVDPNSVNIINGYPTNNNTNHAMSPNGVNGVDPINGMPPQGLGQPMPGMAFMPTLQTTSFQQPGLISYGPPLGYALVPIHSHVNSPPPMPMAQGPPQSAYYPPPNGISVPATNGAIRSCCAPGLAHISQPQQQQQQVRQPQSQVQPPQQAQTQQPTEPPKKSCCGGGAKDATANGPNDATHQATRTTDHALAQHQQSFSNSELQQHHQQQQQQQQEPFAVSYPNNSTVFTYPPNLGTWNVPLNPAMWAQLQQQATQQQPQSQLQDYQNSLPPTPNGGTTPALGTPTMGTRHECSCGPGCQCVGCLAHPFNSQTLEYVGAAWDYDVDVPYSNNSPAKTPGAVPTAQNSNHAPVVQPNGSGITSHGTSGAKDHITNGTQQQQQPLANPEVGSPPQAHTPSDASGLNEELSADNFMFVNLPLYQCGGSLAFCPCGDDCQCVGCMVHNQPLFEEQ